MTQIVRRERVGLSIEREKFFAVAREPHIDAAFQFVGIECMRRLAELEHHEVGNVDDVVDRTNADALDLRTQPLRTRPDFHIVDLARGEKWTFARRGDCHACFLVGRCSALPAGDRLRYNLLVCQRRDLAGQPEMAEQIAAVRRDLDVENRVAREKIG